jgi:hypothetical protein
METLHPIQRFDLPTPSFNYSTYTLAELFKERYWVDVRTEPNRIRALEQEIEKRCAHIRERATQTRFSPTSMSRFKPYGLISGVLVLLICTGPFVALELLDLINLLSDAHADLVGLSGVWALLTLPLVIIAFVMGTVRDAERVVNWFDLAGREQLPESITAKLYPSYKTAAAKYRRRSLGCAITLARVEP